MKSKIKNKVLIFGAGNIGRGLVAYIFNKNDFEIIFVDKNQDLIDEINQKKQYKIIDINSKDEVIIKNIQAIHLEDAKLKTYLKQSKYITTSLGSNNLKYLVPYLQEHFQTFSKLQFILCFENGYKISSEFAKLFFDIQPNIRFIDLVVDRIIPSKKSKNIDVFVDNFFEVIADKNEQKRSKKLKLISYVKDIDAYTFRKLLLVNSLHSYLGYLGYLKKLKFVSESANDVKIIKNIKNLASINIKILTSNFKEFKEIQLQKYFLNTLKRFKNKQLFDLNTRVARNPITKISENERFNLIYQNVLKFHLNKQPILDVFKSILQFDFVDDKQAQEIQNAIKMKQIKHFLQENTKLNLEDIKTLLKVDNEQNT
ncbi:mannitol-1-phosphate 5-dehydrogenase [Mycoplasma sp. 1654_15]|uniref:mannitol-1-phosphate 5-dehydrogenase n=1 Tax=Mycoplasma sp. 1654_15 TaxID=2725994 RepID=UPI001448DF72|nr:mannitol-1-phosphate 5-dehydrogenase [Mycoplasma sp. 1654_15]QJB71417.1 mannitol-1-phosphate 5-dehydrogenase [Mycoplasma sp. 1654_15]